MTRKIKEKILKYNVIFQPEPEGGYTVIVPTLRGCVTYGKTLKEAKTMAIDAIGGFIASMKADGEDIPTDERSIVSTLRFRTPSFTPVQ